MMQTLIDFIKAIATLSSHMDVNDIFPTWTHRTGVPYIIITEISGEFETDKARVHTKSSRIFQVDVFASNFGKAKIIGDLVETVHGVVSGEYTFFLQSVRDIEEETTKQFRRSLDVSGSIQA